jgi:hypothetical protein
MTGHTLVTRWLPHSSTNPQISLSFETNGSWYEEGSDGGLAEEDSEGLPKRGKGRKMEVLLTSVKSLYTLSGKNLLRRTHSTASDLTRLQPTAEH